MTYFNAWEAKRKEKTIQNLLRKYCFYKYHEFMSNKFNSFLRVFQFYLKILDNIFINVMLSGMQKGKKIFKNLLLYILENIFFFTNITHF